MGTLTVSIAGTSVQVIEKSFQETDAISAVSTLMFQVRDDAGTSHFTKGQQVSITDSVNGLQYTGFVSAAIEDRVFPNTLIITNIGVRDNHVLAEKRTYDGPDLQNVYAGVMFCLLLNTLASEGIVSKYAVRRDTTATDFNAGTLTGVVGTSNVGDGDLELSPAGTNVTNNDNLAASNTQIAQASDTFTRANQSGWGTASDGETWTFMGHTATESITSNEGVISANLGSTTWAQLGTQALADQQLQCRIAINNSTDSPGLQARSSFAGATGYELLWYSGAVHLSKSVGGTVTSDLAPSVTFTMTLGTFYQFKLACVGTTIYGKVWQDGTSEPTNWMLTATDTSIGSGGFILQASSSTGTGIQFDHFTASPIGTVSIDAQNNQLNLHAYNVIKMTGTCAIAGLSNAFVYWKIWTGSHLIASGDTIQYDVWISSTSPQARSAVDFVCTDGTSMRDFNNQANVDQLGIAAHPGSGDLSGFATDTWYSRSINVSAMAGKTMSFLDIAFQGSNVGNYQTYFRNIKLTNGGVTQVTFYDSTTHPYDPQNATLNANAQVSNNGYANIKVQQITAYDQFGYRLSSAISIDAVKVVNSSQVSWASVVPTGIAPAAQVSGSNAPPVPIGTTLTILTSIDNQVTWQPAMFDAPIVDLEAGFNVAGRNLYTQMVLAITGTTPEITPAVSALNVSVTTASISGTVNSLTSDALVSDFALGTNANTQNWLPSLTPSSGGIHSSVGVTLLGMFYDWNKHYYVDQQNTNYQTLFGATSPAQSIFQRSVKLTSGAGTDVRSRLESYSGGPNSFQNFTAQVLVQIPASGSVGIVYRTTGWAAANNTFAYAADLSTTTVLFEHGTNGGANTNTIIASAALTLTAGNWYTLKVVVNGTNHQIFVDEVLYINSTDATYTATGQLGLRFYNPSASTASGFFQNFGVVNTLSGATWTSPAVSLNALGTIGNSAIFWNSIVPTGGSLTCASSIDGGTTWQAVAQGGQIGNAAPGTSVVGKSVQLQFTFTSPNASVTPILQAVTIWAVSQVTGSGNRVSPVLSLANVGRLGGSVVAWNANLPSGCTLGVDTAIDGGAWTDQTGSNGGAIAGITAQPAPTNDSFTTQPGWTSQDINSPALAGSYTYNPVGGIWTILGAGFDIFGTNDQFRYTYLSGLSGNFSISARVVSEQNTSSFAKAGLMIRQSTAIGDLYYHVFMRPGGGYGVEYRTSSGGSAASATTGTGAFPQYLQIQNSGTSYSAYTSNDGINWTLIPSSTVTVPFTGTVLAGLTVCSHNTASLCTAVFDHVVAPDGTETTYTNNGGALVTWDPTNSRITLTGGTLATYINNLATGVGDVDMFVDMDESDNGGLVWHFIDGNNFYDLIARDGSSVGSPQSSLTLFRTLTGTRTQVAQATGIVWPRGSYHRFRITMLGSVITVYMDGIQKLTYTDGTPVGAGKCGMRNDTAAAISRYYQLNIQPQGQDVTSHTVQTRLRLATTNPQATPQVLDITLCAFGTTIALGVLVPQTNYYHKYCDKNIDDLAKRSNYWWYIDKNKVPYFLPTNGIPAPWIGSSTPGWMDNGVLAADFQNANITVEDSSDLYRNRQIIDNVLAPVTINENRKGDGVAKSWTFGNQWAGAPTITVTINGISTVATVGVKNVDTGKQFYYAVGDPTITEDNSGPTYDATVTINFSGPGQYLTFSQADNTTEQAALAAIDGTSGIVVNWEDGTGLTKAQGDALAQDRLNQYSKRGRLLKATTRRYGLAPGQLLNLFLPEHGINDGLFLVRQVQTTLTTEGPTGSMVQQPWYAIEAISGADVGDWTKMYQRK